MSRILIISILSISILSCNRYLLTDANLNSKGSYNDIILGLKKPKDVYFLNLHMPDSLPKEIIAFKRLNGLDIYKPKFNKIPSYISRFKNLQTLMILDAEIDKMPNEIVKLRNLRWLRLWNLKLSTLPSDIGKLKKLEKLELFANDIRQLPQSISKLSSLQEIGLDNNNRLDFYDAIEKLYKLPNLSYLNLNYYPHDTLPSNLYKLKNLETITLWNNTNGKLNLEEAFKKLAQLKKLKKIDLSGTPVDDSLKQHYLDILKLQCNDCEIVWNQY